MTATAEHPHTVDEQTWRELAREIGSELAPTVVEGDIAGEISTDSFDRIRSSGLADALVPVEFGGGGARHTDMGTILRELGRHDPAVAVTLSMHSHLVATQLWRHKHGMDASTVFRKVAEGALLISTGASDWVGSSGQARRVDDGFIVSARKTPASGCEVGSVVVTSIRWDDSSDGAQVIHCSIPMAAEGVSIDKTWDTLGMRATGSHTIILDEVHVPDAAVSLIRPADEWHPIWNVVLGSAMPLIVAAYMGLADAAVDLALQSCAGRNDSHVIQLIGEMMNAHTTAGDTLAAMFQEASDLEFPNENAVSSRILSRKTTATDALIDTVRLAIEATGGRGYLRSSPLERLYRDIHGCLFHPLPRAKQTSFTGRVSLGLNPVG